MKCEACGTEVERKRVDQKFCTRQSCKRERMRKYNAAYYDETRKGVRLSRRGKDIRRNKSWDTTQ